MPITQRQLLDDLRARHLASHERIMKAVKPLDPARLVQRPEPNAWSAGIVLEHLCVSDEAYAPRLASALGAARADAGAPAREWSPALVGGWLAKFLAKPGKLPAPKTFQPGPTPRNGIVEAFVARQLEALKLMEDSSSIDWRAVRVGSPAAPKWFPKMNLGDVFTVRAVHVNRHAGQIERAIGRL